MLSLNFKLKGTYIFSYKRDNIFFQKQINLFESIKKKNYYFHKKYDIKLLINNITEFPKETSHRNNYIV